MLFIIIILVYPNTCSPMKAHLCSKYDLMKLDILSEAL